MMLSNVASSISIPEAAITALLGYAVVFTGLLLLMIVVIVMGKVMSGAAEKKADAPAPVAAAPVAAPAVVPVPAAAPSNVPAPGTAGQILLVDTTEKEAACIMAIVANQMGKPLNELRFVSIKKEVK